MHHPARHVELAVVNLRPPTEAHQANWWEEIGVWRAEAGGKVPRAGLHLFA